MTDELRNILTAPEQLERKIKLKKQDIEAIEAAAYPAGIRYDRDKVQTSPRDDQIPEIIAKAEPLTRELEALQERYSIAVISRNHLLETLNPLTAEVIKQRIVEKKRWDDMKPVFHYSRSTMKRICDDGIRDMESTLLLRHFGLKNKS